MSKLRKDICTETETEKVTDILIKTEADTHEYTMTKKKTETDI